MAVRAKAKRKSGKDLQEKPSVKPSGIPQPHGGMLVPGAGGGPQPGSGRPTDTFVRFMENLRNDPKARAALVTAAQDPESKNFSTAWKYATDYDDAKPAKKIEVVEALTTAQRAEKVRKILERAKSGG